MNPFLSVLTQFFTTRLSIWSGGVGWSNRTEKILARCVLGTLKTVLGFLIIGVGSTAIVTSLTPVTKMMTTAFGLVGIYPHDIIVSGSIAGKLGTEVGLILGIGFLVNLIVARFTPFKYVFLTGNYLFIYAATWTALLNAMGFNSTVIIIAGSIIQGVFCAIFPALSQPLVRKAIEGKTKAEFAVGHGHVVGTWIGIGISLLFGKDKNKFDEEKADISDTGAFFRDMSVTMTLVMLALVFVFSYSRTRLCRI